MKITPFGIFGILGPRLQAIVTERGGPAACNEFELDDTVLRAGGYAWDIGETAAAPLYAQIETIKAQHVAALLAAQNAPPTKEALKSRIAWRRWEVESGGAQVTLANNDTFTIKTDAESQSKLTGLLVVASAQPVSVQWKDAAGEFHTIGNSDVLAMVSAVFGHVQACFAREAELLDQLESVDDTATFKAVVEAFWPA